MQTTDPRRTPRPDSEERTQKPGAAPPPPPGGGATQYIHEFVSRRLQ